MQKPSPTGILHYAYGYWASAILATSLRHDLFTHLESDPCDAVQLAERARLSPRGVQALLDALLGMGLVRKANVRTYENTSEASTYLVRGTPDYMGGYAGMILGTWRHWDLLPEVVTHGKPLHKHENASSNDSYWEEVVPALAPLGFPPALAAAERLGISQREEFASLDVGGGAGAFSVTWLKLNPRARCRQIDWPNVNEIARRYVTGFGVADRFETIDGDMEQLDLGEARYDCVIYSNIATGLSGPRNTAMLRKIKRALKPDGSLLIVSLVLNEDRTGDPLLLLFNANLILNSEEGSLHRRVDYSAWLREAAYSSVRFEPLADLPFTLIYAS